jgi:hypothetical protein
MTVGEEEASCVPVAESDWNPGIAVVRKIWGVGDAVFPVDEASK